MIKVLDELAGKEWCVCRYDFGDNWVIHGALQAVLDQGGRFTRKVVG